MLKSVGYRLQIRLIKEQDEPCYILIEAVPITDYSAQIELSQDSRLNFTMDDKQDGVNHLVVTGKGEMQERTYSICMCRKMEALERRSITRN